MALPIALSILIPGIGIPIIANWMAGEIKFGRGREITEDSLRKIAISAMAGIGVGAMTYILTRPTEAAVVTTTTPVPKAERPIKMAAPVSVKYVSHPISEFYSGAGPYPESQHIYVD